MVKGLYTAYTGMVNEQKRMDIETNNLANVNSTGFKEERSVSQSFRDLLGLKIKDYSDAPWTARRLGLMNPGVKLAGSYTNFEQGGLRQTGQTYDVALNNGLPDVDDQMVNDNMGAGGNAFFATSFASDDPDGGGQLIKYTRDGNFTLTQDGYLVTSEGNNVLDVNNNPIQLDPNSDSTILQDGRIVQNQNVVSTIQVARFDSPQFLQRYQDNAFIIGDGGAQVVSTTAAEANATVNQGYLEASNVSVVDEMVNIISIQRNYETNSKVMQAEEDTLDIAVNQLGKVQ
ncbi:MULTISPECIES: flagellar hook-basal body protein [unclassified Butyrivibrio]|jgi:flagellar basal-body rod protein FlgG|uniref:flagellar hook-basal body protein n=1 Tax=unclassified Butyrivibrio TaxID=2639466 RepID=UPI000422FDBD|nr:MULTISPECIES: flagellar hook-basal body protein [unclassified Butyrivibrio]MCR5343500.1 flagellar hook-basal body protein [Butyrivibrio sp.]